MRFSFKFPQKHNTGFILICNQYNINIRFGEFMRPRTQIVSGQVGAIRRAMLAAPNKSAFQRLQCLWLRAKEDLSTEAIAQTVGFEREPCPARVVGLSGMWVGPCPRTAQRRASP